MRFDEIDDTQNITELLKKHFTITRTYSISNGFVNIDGDCTLNEKIKIIRLPVKFGNVSGNFDCGSNKLTSLQGAPTSVGGHFYCNSNQLTSLQGAPTSVDRDFYCNGNQLTSLQGAPTSVGGDFDCRYTQLTSLQGAPTSVGGSFDCRYTQLTSLQGAPTSVGTQLTSLQGAPVPAGGDFYCDYNKNLELLKLLFIKNLKSIVITNQTDVSNILNKYLGKGRGGALACAAELARAGFNRNARK